MARNVLYYGDNLDVLRRYVKDEVADLVYLDPPFNSNQAYNVLFAEKNGSASHAQITAFDDTWHWDRAAVEAYEEIVEKGGQVSRAMQAFRQLLGDNDMLAYLAMMAPRLVELRRVLKSTGSMYLHCDPTASHYLKILMDAVFGPDCFRTEIIWKRSSAHSDTKQGRKQHGRIHDVILFYTKTDQWTWNPQYTPYDPEYVDQFYKFVEEGTGRRYRLDNLTGPGGAKKGNPRYEVMGVTRYWRYTKEKMDELIHQGRVVQTRPGAVPAYKRHLDEMPGVPLQDVWTDIKPIASQAAERLGYPTQKPEALLQRIIKASSNEADLVLDPFCGCGTTISVAERLNRRWMGIDITYLAIDLIKRRLQDSYGEKVKYEVIGEPRALSDAQALADQDPFQFQLWALGLLGARRADIKKGADRGIDGELYFHDEGKGGKTKHIVLPVKSGRVGVKDVRELRAVMEREKAEMAVLITLKKPTRTMRSEAAGCGLYESPGWKKRYPRLQILTVADLLAGKRIECPALRYSNATFKKARKSTPDTVNKSTQCDLFDNNSAPSKKSK
jgi:DNA modification methylase